MVLLLGAEALLGGGTLGGVGHLSAGILTRGLEQTSLRQHAGGYHRRRITQLRDIGLLSETVHTEIHIGVAAGFAVDLRHGVLKFDFLILGHNK